MQRGTKKEVERGERGKRRGGGRVKRNSLVVDSRLFFQSSLRPAHFTPPTDRFEPMKNSFLSKLVQVWFLQFET